MSCFIEYILLILGFFKHSLRKGCFIGWVNEDGGGGKNYAARDTVFSESERKERSNSNSSRQSSSLILNF